MLGMDEFCLKQSRYEYEAKCVDFHTAIVLGKWVKESNKEGKATNFTFSTTFAHFLMWGWALKARRLPSILKFLRVSAEGAKKPIGPSVLKVLNYNQILNYNQTKPKL